MNLLLIRYLIIFLLILSGVIGGVFSFAPYNYNWIMLICLVVLFSVLLKKDNLGLRSFQLGYIWGLFYFFVHNYWLKVTLNEIIGFNIFISIIFIFLFASYLAIYPAIVFWFIDRFKFSIFIRLIIIIPAFWVIMEYFRSILLTGYSWGEVGYSHVDSILAGYVPLGGIHLLTYVIILISCLIVYLIFFARVFLIKFIIIFSIILIYILGWYLLKIDFTSSNKNFSTIAAVQGNIPQDLKFSYSYDSINLYLKQINLYPDVDIMVFPETAIPIAMEVGDNYILDNFKEEGVSNNTSLIIGLVTKVRDKGFLNSALVMNPDDIRLLYYSKNHLVPFGEYRPFYGILKRFYDKLDIPLSDLLRGGANQRSIKAYNQKVAINICYEDGFGDELINTARDSTLLVNMSNMGWYGKSHAMDLQLQQSQARALELGRMLVRSTNNGKTAIISNKGKILSILPRDVMQVLVYKIEGFSGQTPFMRMGGSKILILILSLIVLFTFIFKIYIK